MFGYGMSYYKYSYAYNGKDLDEINRTYKAVFVANAGNNPLPEHE